MEAAVRKGLSEKEAFGSEVVRPADGCVGEQ